MVSFDSKFRNNNFMQLFLCPLFCQSLLKNNSVTLAKETCVFAKHVFGEKAQDQGAKFKAKL